MAVECSVGNQRAKKSGFYVVLGYLLSGIESNHPKKESI